MTITKKQEGGKLTILLEGRVDTATAPELEKECKASIDGITELVFDMENLKYISSAGLRIFMSLQKKMKKQGSMKLIHVSDSLMEIFTVTGFSHFLTIE